MTFITDDILRDVIAAVSVSQPDNRFDRRQVEQQLLKHYPHHFAVELLRNNDFSALSKKIDRALLSLSKDEPELLEKIKEKTTSISLLGTPVRNQMWREP